MEAQRFEVVLVPALRKRTERSTSLCKGKVSLLSVLSKFMAHDAARYETYESHKQARDNEGGYADTGVSIAMCGKHPRYVTFSRSLLVSLRGRNMASDPNLNTDWDLHTISASTYGSPLCPAHCSVGFGFIAELLPAGFINPCIYQCFG